MKTRNEIENNIETGFKFIFHCSEQNIDIVVPGVHGLNCLKKALKQIDVDDDLLNISMCPVTIETASMYVPPKI